MRKQGNKKMVVNSPDTILSFNAFTGFYPDERPFRPEHIIFKIQYCSHDGTG